MTLSSSSFLCFSCLPFLFSSAFSLCPVFFLLSPPNYSFGRNPGETQGLLGEKRGGGVYFSMRVQAEVESAEEELEWARLSRGLWISAWCAVAQARPRLCITTGCWRPGVPTRRVLNCSLGDLIGGNSRRFVCPFRGQGSLR